MESAIYEGVLSDSSKARSSGGSSRSLKACWLWLAEKGISTSYWVDMFATVCQYILFLDKVIVPCGIPLKMFRFVLKVWRGRAAFLLTSS